MNDRAKSTPRQETGRVPRQVFKRRAEPSLKFGAIYTTLHRLEDEGFVTSHFSEPVSARGGRSRRHYALSGVGQRALIDAERGATAMWAGVKEILRPRTS